MVPEAWKKVRFNEVTQIANGQVDPKCEPYSEMAHIGPENVISHTGQITGCKTGKELGLISGKYEFDEYAIVYSKIRPNLNKVCKPGFRGLCSADMYPIWAKNGLNIDYLYHYMLSPAFYKLAVAMSMRTGMPKINRSDLNAVQIAIPPLPEQKKIAQILSIWDHAITATKHLLENSLQRKKGLMQQLLTGKKRLPGYEGEWKEVKVGEILSVRKDKQVPSEDAPLYSLTIDSGITEKTDRYNREFLVKDSKEKQYKVVFPKDIVYNPANLRWGAINFSRLTHPVVVSPIYEVLYVTEPDKHCFEYIAQSLMRPDQINKFASMVEGTLMERMAVKIGPFLATRLQIPPSIEEEQGIAQILTTSDQEIFALDKRLLSLKQEKKSLMQQLLTGKRRLRMEAS